MTAAPARPPESRPAGRPAADERRPFVAGSVGWTVDDLSDPDHAWAWDQGRLELADGVLAQMAPAGFQGVEPTNGLRDFLYDTVRDRGIGGRLFTETDLLLRPSRIPKPDLLYLTAEQYVRQKEIEHERNLGPAAYRPVFVTPLLIVETISVGHERHDRVTKREWYAAAKVPHYWLLDPGDRSLECLALGRRAYRREALGRGDEVVRSALFGGVDVPLARVWGD